MPQGITLILRQDLENPALWESDTFAFDFKNEFALIAGDSLTNATTPVITFAVGQPAPVGYILPTVSAITVSGTQVQCTITLATGAMPATFAVSCLAYTTAGKKLVIPGTLEAQASS